MSKNDQNYDELSAQIESLTAALQRERADATNMRRQHESQMASLRTVVKAGVVEQLLPIIDNFERALQHVPKDLVGSDYIKGIQSIVSQFEKTLADMGVERIATVGEPFDPNLHEALAVDGEGDQEVVSEELEAGYQLNGQVLRPAKVRIKMQ